MSSSIDLQESMELGSLGNYEDPVLKFLTNENGETTVEGFPFFQNTTTTEWNTEQSSSPWNNTTDLSLDILGGNATEVAVPSPSELALDLTSLPYDSNLQPLYESLFNTTTSYGLASNSSPGSSSSPSSPGTVASTPIMPLLLPKEEEKAEDKMNARRKRQRRNKKGDSDPVAPTAITLPREQLLMLTSEDLDDYVAKITAVRPLTAEEEKDVKRQRRLIKNRESAQMSRERKKVFVDDLRVKVNALQQENNQMASKITELSAENRALKEEVAQLQGVINKSSFLTHLLNSMTSIKSKSDDMSLAAISNRAKAAGVCLMIVIFSFGLLFNSASVTAPTITREPIPQVLPDYASSHHVLSPNMREILEVFPEATPHRRYGALQFDTEPTNTQPPSTIIPSIVELPSTQAPETTPAPSPAPTTNVAPSASFARTSSVKLGNMLSQQQQQQQNQQQPLNTSHIEHGIHVTNSAEDIVVDHTVPAPTPAPSSSGVKPNITYLLCNDPQVIDPPANANNTGNIDPSAPFLIALMIPPGVLQARNLLSLPQNDPSALLQVTCQVLDINIASLLANGNNTPAQTVSTQA